MGSKGRAPPPYHHRGAHEMMHRDPYGGAPGMPGPFPYDMLAAAAPPPEILEQKLMAQRGELQKLAVENDRLAMSHDSLRKELAAAQQEAQRLQAQGQAARAAEEQEARGILDKVAKMEADLKARDPVKAELKQAHAEAQGLVVARQQLAADTQKLSKDLQRNLGEAQQLPALVAERDAARQEYQHLRATYEYERKLRMDHSESLQVMKRNYDTMVAELDKLRAELMNTANIDRGGMLYNTNTAQKDDGAPSLPVGQIAYDSGYGAAQGRTPPAGLGDSLSGNPAGTAPRTGFDPSRGNMYDASRIASFSSSKAGGHDASRGAAGYNSLKGAGYDPSKAPALGGQATAAAAHGSSADYYGSNQATPPSYAWGQAASAYGSAQVPQSHASGPPVQSTSYSATTARNFGSAQALPSYAHAQEQPSYGHAQLPSSYGLAQASFPFAPAQGVSPYGSGAQPPQYGAGQAATNPGSAYQAPHGRK
ncbi:protein FLX-like 2 [Oryza glaberrima]|uniref:Protein FLX-like 2 n=1 Tax=Oryza glaberrima TaxID=4538 RepID=I1NY45_ORYGL|nr:protein FLX-like 2 [Oryza glaberrima]